MVGLTLRNPADGRVVFDSNTSTTHIRVSFETTSGLPGSVTIPGLSSAGVPFILSAVPTGSSSSVLVQPIFSFSGDTVAWTAGPVLRVIVASHSG